MIVCSCNIITRREIERTITDLLDEDCWRLIVPLQVYHAMKKRGRCCGCFAEVTQIIVSVTEAYHRNRTTPECEVVSLIGRLRKQHEQCETARMLARERMKRIRAA
jgi:hypothetical protein